MSELRWAPPGRDDDEAWAGLLAAIEVVDQHGESYELADLADERASVWAHPETDSVFVWDGDELVAFGWLKTQVGQRERHRIACWGGVRPSHRGRGIGRELLDRQVSRASAVAAALDASLPTEIVIEGLDTQRDLLDLVARAGFEEVRRFLELARPVTGAVPAPVPVPEGLALRAWDERFDELTRAAHTEAFAESWGSEPRSVEEWQQWYTGHRAFRPDLSFVLTDEAGEVTSYALCAAYPQDWHAVPREVWINTVGTRPSWRGRGAARATLTAVLEAAARAADGFDRAILGVDAANPTGAEPLYRSLGFDDVRTMVTFVRGPR